MASQLAPRQPADVTPDEWLLLQAYRQHHNARLHGGGWRIALEALLAVRSLATLAVLGLVLLLALNFVGVSGQLGQRVGAAVERTGQVLGTAAQGISDAFDPTHPPRYPISQDAEFSALQIVHTGEAVGDSQDYTFTVAAIRHRDNAGTAEFSEFAELNRQYKVPRETKILGITIRTDRGEQQFTLDRGVTFRIGTRLFKVNWISATDQQLALAVYRSPDQFTGKLAFESG